MRIKSWCQVGGLIDSFCGVNLEIVSINGPMKLVLLGISYNYDGSGDPNAGFCLQPLPEYMIPAHGGQDGHLCRNPTLAKCGVKPNTWKK
jgi:hypothetical protein